MERLGLISKSPEVLNFYLNHSSIYPNITPDGTGYIDGTELLLRPDTYMFTFKGGCLIFFKEEVYKGDIYFLPRQRGASAKAAALECLEFMFSVTDRIIVEAPDCNKASQRFIGSLGFKRSETRPKAWKKNGVLYDVVIYEMVRNGKCS